MIPPTVSAQAPQPKLQPTPTLLITEDYGPQQRSNSSKICGIATCRRYDSAPLFAAPEQFVQLHLKAHIESIIQYPLGQVAGRNQALGR